MRGASTTLFTSASGAVGAASLAHVMRTGKVNSACGPGGAGVADGSQLSGLRR